MGVLWIVFNGLVVFTLGLWQMALGSQGESHVVVCLGILRIDLERSLILGYSRVEVALLGEHAAQITVRFSITRIAFNGRLVVFDCFFGMTGSSQRDCQVVMRLRVIGLHQDGLPVLANRFLRLARVRKCLAKVIQCASIGGAHLHGFGPLGNGGGVLALLGQVGSHIELLV